MTAELIIENAHIRTLDPEKPFATHIAITDGMIAAIGGADDVKPHHGSQTRLIDGKDLHITPGITDSHFHPFWGTIATRGADLTKANTLDELRAILRAERDKVGPDAWVIGWGLTFEMFQETGIRGDLFADAVDGGLAYLRFFEGHTSVASPAAIAFSDVTGRETFGEYSEVVTDEHGVPTGELREGKAMELITRHIPEPSEETMYGWYLEEMKKWNALGITGMHNMDGTPETYPFLRKMEEKGDLTVRMIVPLHQQPHFELDYMREQLQYRDEKGTLFRGGVAKFFNDGVIESGTAWLIDPDTKGMNTEPFWPDPNKYKEAVRIFAEAGFQCATHAVGDMAVRCALDAYEAAGVADGLHHRIEHIEQLDDADVPRFARLSVGASMQPLHMNAFEEDGSDEWSVRVGPERRKRGFRTRDLLNSGAILALGSDWMVAPYDPRIGMAWARLRRPGGMPEKGYINREQALTPEEVLAGYTTEAARIVSEEAFSGMLKVGYRGDLTAFAADLIETDADALLDLPILLTVVHGRVVFEA